MARRLLCGHNQLVGQPVVKGFSEDLEIIVEIETTVVVKDLSTHDVRYHRHLGVRALFIELQQPLYDIDGIGEIFRCDICFSPYSVLIVGVKLLGLPSEIGLDGRQGAPNPNLMNDFGDDFG